MIEDTAEKTPATSDKKTEKAPIKTTPVVKKAVETADKFEGK
jgi:hypothetical protein